MRTHREPVMTRPSHAPVPTTGAFRAGSSNRAADVAVAAGCIAAGRTVGFLNRTVCALFGASDTRAFPDEVIRVKGENRRTKPVAMFLSAKEIACSVDPAGMPQALVPLLTNPDALRQVLAGLVLLRLPLRRDAAAELPDHLFSHRADGTPVAMIADPGGYQPLQDLFDTCRAQGVRFLSDTFMNASGQPEIVDQRDGIEFSRRAGLPMFLADDDYSGRPAGSPAILEVQQDDVVLVRDGFIPLWAFEHLLGVPVGFGDDARPARHAQIMLERDACTAMAPRVLCRHLLHQLQVQRTRGDHLDLASAAAANAVVCRRPDDLTGLCRGDTLWAR